MFTIPAHSSVTLNARLYASTETPTETFGKSFDSIFESRKKESQRFYDNKIPKTLTSDERSVCIQALSGLLWSKQFYHFVTKDWLEGDPEVMRDTD